MSAVRTRRIIRLAQANKPLGRYNKLKGIVLDAEGKPLARLVQIMSETKAATSRTPPIIRQVKILRPDANGEWQFSFVPEGSYTVIAHDHTGQFDPAIKSGLTPEPME